MRSKKTDAKRAKRLPVERATYSVDELAVLLGRGRLSVYADLAAGRIPSRRLGTKYLISREVIHQWLNDAA